MDGRRRAQTLEMKLSQKGVTLSSPTDETAGRQKIYCIPDTVIADKAVGGGGHNHRNAPCDTASDPGYKTESLNRQQLAVHEVTRNTLTDRTSAFNRDNR